MDGGKKKNDDYSEHSVSKTNIPIILIFELINIGILNFYLFKIYCNLNKFNLIFLNYDLNKHPGYLYK